MHRAALDRLMKLQASERERAPRVELVEAATPSLAPWWPDYHRDALIALVGSVVFGLFAAWFADFIAGPPALPAIPTLVMQHSWMPTMLGREATSEQLALTRPGIGQLPAPAALPRQLDDPEIVALIEAATEDVQIVVLTLLAGVNTEELVALRWSEIDLTGDVIHVPGKDARRFHWRSRYGACSLHVGDGIQKLPIRSFAQQRETAWTSTRSSDWSSTARMMAGLIARRR
jgi:succinoglycan biosynthesis transport protein ExoP